MRLCVLLSYAFIMYVCEILQSINLCMIKDLSSK